MVCDKVVTDLKTKKDNLYLARKKLAGLSCRCKICGNTFSKAGFSNHVKSCSKGKNCPVCGVWFAKKSVTCSHSCANTHFRAGPKHPNWSEDRYRTTCFFFHTKECVVCKEKNIVEVHHLDEDKRNNDPSNLIPLCPTHHQYWHSQYKHLIEEVVYRYIGEWRNGSVGALEASGGGSIPSSPTK